MTTIKLSYNNEIRRLLFNNNNNNNNNNTTTHTNNNNNNNINLSYSELIKQTYLLYPFLNDKNIQFVYYDDENDRVLVSSEIEFQEALKTMLNNNNGYPKFEIILNNNNNNNNNNTNSTSSTNSSSNSKFNDICAECHSPLTGISYKCSARSNYEICERCERNIHNPIYPMIKFYSNLLKSSIILNIQPRNNNTFSTNNNNNNYIPEHEKHIHKNIRCDGCGMSPIVGIRYKCTGRPNYDLCQNCEANTTSHPFPMIKIYSYDQSPDGIEVNNPNNPHQSTDIPHFECEITLDQGLEFLQQFMNSHHDPQHFQHHSNPPHEFDNLGAKLKEMFQSGGGWEGFCGPGRGRDGFRGFGGFGRCGGGRGGHGRGWGNHHRSWGCHDNDNNNDNNINKNNEPNEGCKKRTSADLNNDENQKIEEDIINITIQQSLEELSTSSEKEQKSTLNTSTTSIPPLSSTNSSETSHSLNDEVIWEKELNILRSMGFTNQELVLPLLKEYLGKPIENGFPSPEKMQRLIFTLLSNV